MLAWAGAQRGSGHGKPRLKLSVTALKLCATGLGCMVIGAICAPAALAQVPPTPPERLNWSADPSAPNFSGLWVLAERQAKAGDRSVSPEGWGPWPPPLKGSFAELWRKRIAAAAGGQRTDDPIRSCQPPGLPRFITGDRSPLLIVQYPGRVMFNREGEGPRRVWLDGRSFPAQADLEPFYKGTAVGRYEGGDLLIESRGFKDEPIDSTGAPHSNQLKVTERYHRVDPQTLSVQITLTDPEAYTRPLTATVTYKAINDPAWEPHEFICTPKTDYHAERYVH